MGRVLLKLHFKVDEIFFTIKGLIKGMKCRYNAFLMKIGHGVLLYSRFLVFLKNK